MNRREMLATLGCGFGTIGLSTVASAKPHFAQRAKHVIFLFLNGGPSQVDTFDPKPLLTKMHGKPRPGDENDKRLRPGQGNLLGSPFSFQKYGQSGIEVSEIFPKVGGIIDEFCVIRSMHTDQPSHERSLLMVNSGSGIVGRPSMGSWITYGLGSDNQDLPGFVVLCPGVPVLGAQLWASAFLPAAYQGTHIPTNEHQLEQLIPYIRPQRSAADQQRQIKLLSAVNRLHTVDGGTGVESSGVESSIKAMETAFRMQTEAPAVFDITKEKEPVRARYGDGDFGRGCLMALRLVEQGVRVVQVYFGNYQPWDNHTDILIHRKLALQADAPIAALVEDLKSRGLLQETLIVVGGEFGRTPAVEMRVDNTANGRNHNHRGFTYLLAGGGIKPGMIHGRTDDFGEEAIEDKVHFHDLQATILNQLGLDHKRLTYRYSGRDFRLTDVEGEVVRKIIA